MSYDTVIFDMDGVLVANSPRWVFEHAATQALATAGVNEPTDRDQGLLSGFPMDIDAAATYFRTRYGLDLGVLWSYRERFASANQHRAMLGGVKESFDDLGVLAELDVDLAVVSNNQHATVESVVRHYDIERHFDAWFGLPPTLQGVRRRKPAPWYLEVAHEAVNGGTSLYVGDKESDVQAATRAGMDSALISRTGNSPDSDVDPTHHITSLADLPALVENPGGCVEHDSEATRSIGGGG